MSPNSSGLTMTPQVGNKPPTSQPELFCMEQTSKLEFQQSTRKEKRPSYYQRDSRLDAKSKHKNGTGKRNGKLIGNLSTKERRILKQEI